MFVRAKFCDLPDMFNGIEFEFANVRQESGRKYKTVNAGLFPNALVTGRSIIVTDDGAEASLLNAQSDILVDVYAEPVGIFVGKLCVALARDLSDDNGRWHYWKFCARDLFEQVKNLYGESQGGNRV